MPGQIFPTKANLLGTKRSLELAKVGFELLDKKRVIMLREMMAQMRDIEDLQNEIDETFAKAHASLQRANFSVGQNEILNIANYNVTPSDISLRFRSVMGVELPVVGYEKKPPELNYGFAFSNSEVDDAYIKFLKAKELTARLAQVENSVYRLAYAIKQTQKRANALKNIVIPRLEQTIYFITGYLEEKERESFTALKIIKNKK
ncbi:MAG: V-type ATP synthase subunit D [Oscillospiraceae bacterium]|nr:V-type ATP synthase subunit D [Oscillospiraceae bacterium]